METYERNIQVAQENKLLVQQNREYVPRTIMVRSQPIVGKLKAKNIIEFFNGTTTQAVRHYLRENPRYNVMIHNMANSHEPGGGYLRGAVAQEEDVCRKGPFLYASLEEGARRRMYNGWGDVWYDRVLYTEDVVFVRNEDYELMDERNHYSCSVITAAAPNMNGPVWDMSDHEGNMKNMIKQIYYTSLLVGRNPEVYGLTPKEHHVLILSAWGCGAFAPKRGRREYCEMVAKYFHNVLQQVGGDYVKICFAITTDKRNNFEIFYRTFMGSGLEGFESVTRVDDN